MNEISSIKNGIKSLWYWRKVIWNNRWYDYGYLLQLIKHQLELMVDDKNKSYTVGWDNNVTEMKKSLRLLEEFNNADTYDIENEIFQEFICSLKTMQNWWD